MAGLGSIGIRQSRQQRRSETELEGSLSLRVKIKLKIGPRRRPTTTVGLQATGCRPHLSLSPAQVLTLSLFAGPGAGEEKCLSLRVNYHPAGAHHDCQTQIMKSLQCCAVQPSAVQSVRYQGSGRSLCFPSHVSQSNTWLVFIRPRPRPPPQHFAGWFRFPNILRGDPAGSIVSTSPYWHWHYSRGDNQYSPLSFLWSPRFSSKMAVTWAELGCRITWWQGFCLAISYISRTTWGKFFII